MLSRLLKLVSVSLQVYLCLYISYLCISLHISEYMNILLFYLSMPPLILSLVNMLKAETTLWRVNGIAEWAQQYSSDSVHDVKEEVASSNDEEADDIPAAELESRGRGGLGRGVGGTITGSKLR